jgi:hypothetical protein
MARRSEKSIAEILTPSTSLSPVELTAKVHTSSSSSSLPPSPSLKNNDDVNFDVATLERKIALTIEGFTTDKFCELILRDRSRLSNENALTICEYAITMKREVNPRLSYKRYTTVFVRIIKGSWNRK